MFLIIQPFSDSGMKNTIPTVTNPLFARTFENSDLDALNATQVAETLKKLIKTNLFGHVSVDRMSFTTPDGNYVAFNRLDVNNKKNHQHGEDVRRCA